MVRVISSKIVNLPQEKVFSVIKDLRKLPRLFPDKYKSFNILEQSDNHILTEEIVSISGKEIKQKVKHILEPNRLLKSEIIEGDTKGTVLKIELNQKSNSRTEIIIDADLKFGKIGAVFGIFAKRKIKPKLIIL
jgi:ribosome-associated toxin RatA of RatAB toxin-antitoxin module